VEIIKRLKINFARAANFYRFLQEVANQNITMHGIEKNYFLRTTNTKEQYFS